MKIEVVTASLTQAVARVDMGHSVLDLYVDRHTDRYRRVRLFTALHPAAGMVLVDASLIDVESGGLVPSVLRGAAALERESVRLPILSGKMREPFERQEKDA